MKSTTNSKAYALTLEELIFLNKNKNYGAYQLRSNYRRNLIWGCIAATIALLIAVYTPQILKKDAQVDISTTKEIPVVFTNTNIDEEIPKLPATTVAPLRDMIKYTQPVVVENTDKEYFPTTEELKNVLPGSETVEGNPDGIDQTLIETPVTAAKEPEPETNKIFTWAEEMPQYIGGNQALFSFIASNLNYPEIARRAGVEGKVFITFLVNRDGTIANVEVAKGIGAGCDEEAARVIRLLGKWTPGRQNGKPVSVKISLPIVFRLS